jgi:bifunctional DNase/RNase
MIPVHVTDVVVNEERETYMVLLQSELHFEGSASVGIGPFSALNISSKLDEQENDVNDSQNLVGELLDDTEVEIRKIRLYRGERGRYRAKVIENLDDDRSQNIYETELSDALALATETGAQLQIPPELLQNEEFKGQDAENNKRDLRRISDLYDQLEEAINDEDFERAEKLKPKLNSAVRQLEQSMDLEEHIEEELRSAYDPDAE